MQNTSGDTLATFVPESAASFARRARWLGSVMGLEHEAARFTLAALYGHHGVTEALAACREVDEGRKEPGPYIDWMPPKMSKRCLDIVKAALGKRAEASPSPIWEYRTLGLFSPEGEAKAAYCRVKPKIDALRGRKPQKTPSVLDYAFLARTNVGNETVLAFTPLGRGVHDAAEALTAAWRNRQLPWHDLHDRMERLQDIHPENPWVAATWNSTLFPMLGYAQWCDAGDRDFARFVADEEEPDEKETDPIFLEATDPDAARADLNTVLRPVELFERLYGATTTYASARLVGTITPDGCDTTQYPMALTLAARVATAAGALDLAARYHRRLIDGWPDHDTYGARLALAMLQLNAGKPVGKLVHKDDRSPEGCLIALAQALEKGRGAEIVQRIENWLTHSTMAIRALHPTSRGCEAITVMSSEQRLGRLRKALHSTKGFWERRPDLKAILDAVAADARVRRAHLAYHRANEKRFGWALTGHQDPGHGDTPERLKQAVEKAVESSTGRASILSEQMDVLSRSRR